MPAGSGSPAGLATLRSVRPSATTARGPVRGQILDAAYDAAVSLGWERVRMGAVAGAAGVSRQTVYNEFGSKDGLGQALVLREADRFLAGVERILDEERSDPVEGVRRAVEFTLRRGGENPLLHTILTSARGGDDSLLPLLTTRSEPVLHAASDVLVAHARRDFPDLPDEEVRRAADALVRLTVSHLVLPLGDPAAVAAELGDLARRLLFPPAGRPDA